MSEEKEEFTIFEWLKNNYGSHVNKRAENEIQERDARIAELETKATHLATIEAELANQKAAYATVAHNLLNSRKVKLADNLRIITLEAQLAAALAGNATMSDGYTETDTPAQLLNCG